MDRFANVSKIANMQINTHVFKSVRVNGALVSTITGENQLTCTYEKNGFFWFGHFVKTVTIKMFCE